MRLRMRDHAFTAVTINPALKFSFLHVLSLLFSSDTYINSIFPLLRARVQGTTSHVLERLQTSLLPLNLTTFHHANKPNNILQPVDVIHEAFISTELPTHLSKPPFFQVSIPNHSPRFFSSLPFPSLEILTPSHSHPISRHVS